MARYEEQRGQHAAARHERVRSGLSQLVRVVVGRNLPVVKHLHADASGQSRIKAEPQRFLNTKSHTPWPKFSPRASNFVSGRISGRGA